MWCIHIVVWIWLLLEKIVFYLIRNVWPPYDLQHIDRWPCLHLSHTDVIFHRWDTASEVDEFVKKRKKRKCKWICPLVSRNHLKALFQVSSNYKKLNLGQPVSWGHRIFWLHLHRGVNPHPNENPGYDIKQSNDEAPVMWELWGM